MPWAAGTLCPGDANPHPSSARDAGHRPLANGKRHEEALVPESLSGFPATISWSIRSCYLSLRVLPHGSSGHRGCNAVMALGNSSDSQV